MKLSYYHYYFKERGKYRANRVCFDIRPLLDAYIDHAGQIWKTIIENEDGEKLLLLRPQTRDGVYMLVATRQQEIIKAINKKELTCDDLSVRLRNSGEVAGFAGYFIVSKDALGLAATLRGPRTGALTRFINRIMERVGAGEWCFEIQPVGASLTMQQAQAMAFVARTTIKVSAGNPLFQRLKGMFSQDSDDVSSFEVVVRNKKNKNIKNILDNMAKGLKGNEGGIDKIRIRAKAVADEILSDYFVEEDGKLSEEIETGSETKIIAELVSKFGQNPNLRKTIKAMKEEALYDEQCDIPELARLGDIDYWRNLSLGK